MLTIIKNHCIYSTPIDVNTNKFYSELMNSKYVTENKSIKLQKYVFNYQF